MFSMDVLSLSLESPEMDLHLNHSSSSGDTGLFGYGFILLFFLLFKLCELKKKKRHLIRIKV